MWGQSCVVLRKSGEKCQAEQIQAAEGSSVCTVSGGTGRPSCPGLGGALSTFSQSPFREKGVHAYFKIEPNYLGNEGAAKGTEVGSQSRDGLSASVPVVLTLV